MGRQALSSILELFRFFHLARERFLRSKQTCGERGRSERLRFLGLSRFRFKPGHGLLIFNHKGKGPVISRTRNVEAFPKFPTFAKPLPLSLSHADPLYLLSSHVLLIEPNRYRAVGVACLPERWPRQKKTKQGKPAADSSKIFLTIKPHFI